MTSEFSDPSEEEDDLTSPPDVDSSATETDEGEYEETADPEITERIAENRADRLLPDTPPSPIDAEEFWQESIQQGNATLERIANQPIRIPQDPLSIEPGSPDAIREAFFSLGRDGESGAHKLPRHRQTDAAAIELYSSTQPTSPQGHPETPPVVVHHLPPQNVGSENSAAKEDRERLRIEVEITLANAERISRIAVEEAKAEFKKLASQATQRLDEKFYEYRANQRLLRRG